LSTACAGDIAARPALVLDHHLLAPHLGEPVGDDAGRRIDRAAGRNGTISRTKRVG
jgi:hypothetical protein